MQNSGHKPLPLWINQKNNQITTSCLPLPITVKYHLTCIGENSGMPLFFFFFPFSLVLIYFISAWVVLCYTYFFNS